MATEEQSMHLYGDEGPDMAMASACLGEVGTIHHATGRNRFSNIEPGISVRESTDNANWEFFRPGDHIPRKKNEIIKTCDNVYRYNGIVKFVIEMMADFVTQGIQVHHPAASKQRRYRHWWKKVGATMVSERIVNLLYRHGVSAIKRNFGALDEEDMKDLDRGVAYDSGNKVEIESDIKFARSIKPGKNRIPLRYTFLNPTTVECVGGELSIFADGVMNPLRYGLRIPDSLIKSIRNAKTTEEKMVVANMPSYITDMIGSGVKMIPLDPEKVSVLHYRKDDWQIWADPLVLSVLKDLILYERMKDTDMAALDGAIRSVRLWTLGLPEYKIQPGPGAMRKLKEQLLAAASGGSIDLVWDATLKLTETNTDVYRYLGSAKYEPVLQAIYAGLGIPQSLTGGGAGGMTNNALSLKTLIERLQYARNILVEFWEREFYILQQAFGDRQPARLSFDMMSLSDEAAEKMLWVQLYDRNIVTTETMREKFGMLDEVERSRLRRETKEIDEGKTPAKIGPFTETQPHPDQLAKAAMAQGTISPTEAGVKKKPKARGDKSLLDHQADQAKVQVDLQKEQMAQDAKIAEKQQKVAEKQGNDLHNQKLQQNDDLHKQKLAQKASDHKKGVNPKGQAGRPTNSKDTKARKTRTPKPRTTASFLTAQVIGREKLREITEIETPVYLAKCEKKNLRALTATQASELETHKFNVLCGDSVEEGNNILRDLVQKTYGDRSLTPNTDEMREMFVGAYALLMMNEITPEGETNIDG